MNLLDLPYDKLYEICESLPLEDLNRFVRTSKRTDFLCGNILKKRKDKLIAKLTKEKYFQMFRLPHGLHDIIEIAPDSIMQDIGGWEASHSEATWPFPEVQYNERSTFRGHPETKRWVNFQTSLTDQQYKDIIENLLNQGYQPS